MKSPVHLVVFRLDDNRFALHLSAVARVIRIVEAVPLPKAPDIVTGVINIQGKIVPVVNIRKRFRIKERAVDINDHMIIAETPKRKERSASLLMRSYVLLNVLKTG
ncbi:MAG: chemotaxis protein CheW [Nitrospirota bacterium]